MRLAEILGSLHFLRNLCGEEGDDWRLQMEGLLQSENPEPMRRARMVARFNHGYASFEANYSGLHGGGGRGRSALHARGRGTDARRGGTVRQLTMRLLLRPRPACIYVSLC